MTEGLLCRPGRRGSFTKTRQRKNGIVFIDRPATNPPHALSNQDAYPPIVLDDEFFLITETNFKKLPVYNSSRPTGVYDGKCWRFETAGGVWWIGCFIEEDPPHPDGLLTPVRKALIILGE